MHGGGSGRWMRRIVWPAALVCVLALVPPGSARDEKVVKLRVGDLIDVAGTQIACQIVVSGFLSSRHSTPEISRVLLTKYRQAARASVTDRDNLR